MPENHPDPGRRRLLKSAAGVIALPLATMGTARAALVDEVPALRELVGTRALQAGRVALDIPRLADNANAVATRVTVDSPMTQADHVRAIHLIAERNPRPLVASFFMGPHTGKALIATRIRLAGDQRIIAVAEMSDGSLWSDVKEIHVTSSACLDGT
jgi:sulfur-oxidizing protein SoxY